MVPRLGAQPTERGCCFRLWSTRARRASVALYDQSGRETAEHPLTPMGDGIFETELAGAQAGVRYKFRLDDGPPLPDPYARYLPDGVHGPAEVMSGSYSWRHTDWAGLPLERLVIYELHVGTFTPEGTFAAARAHLPYLADLGVSAVELMPVAAFPGQRGWGYDGVAHFAPHAAYGTPDELRELVDAAHGLGMAVLLDVVYNHWGPDGNYLGAYSPEYFTSAHKTPWGDAPNFDQAHSAYMRAYVLDNARYWLEEFRFDGLRLDATHSIQDDSPQHILAALAERVKALPGGKLLIAEDERNLPRLVTDYGLDAVWADDFHHQVHVLLTREHDGYYADYRPELVDLAKTIHGGWLYQGEISPHLGRPRGEPATALGAASLVYCIQNHDQVGNRAFGERLNQLTSLDRYRAVSALLLFLPYTPLLFMGQEWAASTPFLYFTDHHAELGAQVTAGRRSEFSHFQAFSTPGSAEAIPDPQAPATFAASHLDWHEIGQAPYSQVLDLYRQLLALRRSDPVLSNGSRERMTVGTLAPDVLWVHRWEGAEHRLLLLNLGLERPLAELAMPAGLSWRPLLGTTAGGQLLPMHSALLLTATGDPA